MACSKSEKLSYNVYWFFFLQFTNIHYLFFYIYIFKSLKVKCKEFLFYFVLITKIVNTVERIKKICFSTLVYWKNISINPSPPNQRNQPFTYLSKGYGFMVLSSYTYMLVIPDCMLCANAGWSDPDLAKMIRIRFLDLDPC